MELLTAFISACQNVKFSSVCIVLLGIILFQSVRQRIAQSDMSEEEKKGHKDMDNGKVIEIIQTICLVIIMIAMIFVGVFAYKSYKKVQEVAAQINDIEYSASSTIDKLNTTIDNARDTISGAKEAVDTISSTLSTAQDISETLNTVDNKIQEMNNNPVFRVMNGKTP